MDTRQMRLIAAGEAPLAASELYAAATAIDVLKRELAGLEEHHSDNLEKFRALRESAAGYAVRVTDLRADLAAANERAEARAAWACFHCGEVFDAEGARLHFGDSEMAEVACTIDEGQLREMERELARYRAEDSDADRAVQSMRADHVVALRKEEEAGYAKGLKAYTQVETERDQVRGEKGGG